MEFSLIELSKKRTVLFDGGLGTELMSRGLPQGAFPESWNIERADVVEEIHRAYFDAGSDVVTTNSFGANRIKLSAHGLESRARELNEAAARIARKAAPAGRYVAGSIGPTGKLLKPQGKSTEEEFEAAFAEQAAALADGGVDVFLVETQYDLREALAAVRGARHVSSLPVFVTMTFNALPRGYFTLMGDRVSKCCGELERAGALAVGANCGLDSEQMVGLVRVMRQATGLPVIAQANAGKPEFDTGGNISYSQMLQEYVRFVPDIVRAGAAFVGGCCGTNPSYIRAMAEMLAGH